MARAVKRGRQRKAPKVVRWIGVDEKAAAKGHRYLTLVCDLEEGTVEHIAEERKQESLEGYYQGLSEEQLAGIEAVAMDMWAPYIQATLARVPEAAGKIVFDRFHVMGYLGKAVDTVRKQEHRALMAAGDETLKGSKYLWLYSRENVPQQRRDEFDILRRKELKVGRAWAIKESLRRLWHYVYPASGWKFWKRWYFWATHSRLQSIRKAAETIHRHIDNILTYYQHPVTNAMSEGLNSKIQKIKSMACGFRNIENFKTAIYFRCGGLDLYPC
jgi:transposase